MKKNFLLFCLFLGFFSFIFVSGTTNISDSIINTTGIYYGNGSQLMGLTGSQISNDLNWINLTSFPTQFWVNGVQIFYLPNQTNYTGTFYVGDGNGSSLSNVGSDAGKYNTYVGFNTGSNSQVAKRNTALGYNALHNATSGWANTALGYNALSTGVGTGDLIISGTGVEFYANTAVGEGTMTDTTTGSYNTAVGVNALLHTTTGIDNVAVGVHALNSNIDGDSNVAIGRSTLYTATSDDYTVAIGSSALQTQNGSTPGNVAIGYSAGKFLTTGSLNVFIGYLAGATGTVAGANTLVGYRAGELLTSDYNTCLGYYACNALTTGGRNIIIGNSINAPVNTNSYQLNIGDTLYGNLQNDQIGIGAMPNTSAALDVQSTTRGFLPPRMSTTQRDAITNPPEGLLIYDNSTHKLSFYNGTSWVYLAVE